MQLGPEETRKLNESLAALKQMTAEQIKLVAQDRKIGIDAGYVNKLIETYVTEDGFACLLLDTLLTKQDCTCGVSCAQPCNYYMRCKVEGHPPA